MSHSLTPLMSVMLLLLTMAVGCSTNSTVTKSYVDKQLLQRDLSGVLVLAVANREKDRIDFEDAFAKSLKRHGVKAVPSHTVLPDGKVEAEEVIAAAGSAGVDTILVTRYVGQKAEDVYHPGTIYYDVMPAYAGPINRYPFGGYYGHAYEVAYEQPVWTTNRTYTLISDLFIAETREHMWQAVSDTIRAGSDNKLRDDIITGFVRDMQDQQLLD